jgi:hypothetical protein
LSLETAFPPRAKTRLRKLLAHRVSWAICGFLVGVASSRYVVALCGLTAPDWANLNGFILLAIVFFPAGTLLQAYGSAKVEKESSGTARHRAFALAIGSLLTALAIFSLWSGQQVVSQQASAKPVLDIFADTQKMLHIRNLGTVNIEDVTIHGTSYVLRAVPLPEGGGHMAITGIESVSNVGPLLQNGRVAKGTEYPINLATWEYSRFFPVYDGVPDISTERGRTVYCFRVSCRNAITKQRLIRYVVIGAFKGFPDIYAAGSRAASGGGGYESSVKLLEIRRLIRSYQMSLFDDETGDLYRD